MYTKFCSINRPLEVTRVRYGTAQLYHTRNGRSHKKWIRDWVPNSTVFIDLSSPTIMVVYISHNTHERRTSPVC